MRFSSARHTHTSQRPLVSIHVNKNRIMGMISYQSFQIVGHKLWRGCIELDFADNVRVSDIAVRNLLTNYRL